MKSLDEFIAQLIHGLVAGMGLLPVVLVDGITAAMAGLWFRMDKRHRQITLDNLAHAYGDQLSADQAQRLARQIFTNFVRMPFEMGWSLHRTVGQLINEIEFEGIEHFNRALDKGRGVLLLTGHVGCWEILPISAVVLDAPINIVYRPLDFYPLELFIQRFRTRFGSRLVPAARSMRRMLKGLKKGESMAILLDQSVDWYEGAFVKFFGRTACTNKGLALMAMASKAPVVPIFLIRIGRGYKVTVGREIPLADTGDRTRDIETNTQRYNDAIEAIIRQYPDQWLWLHRRWKTKPYCLLPDTTDSRHRSL